METFNFVSKGYRDAVMSHSCMFEKYSRFKNEWKLLEDDIEERKLIINETKESIECVCALVVMDCHIMLDMIAEMLKTKVAPKHHRVPRFTLTSSQVAGCGGRFEMSRKLCNYRTLVKIKLSILFFFFE